MPPSGFQNKHSTCISDFLRSCLDDLLSENKGVRTPDEALQRELNHISTDLGAVRRDKIPTTVLELARSFYEDLKKKKSKDFDELERHAEELLSSVERQIEAIKVADVL